ncbi:hypothetical protein JT359_15375 [Candidatus Poribacteria bacterium]|nr:hypothetical protein [Candidatus Poribacteria bacterium]
MRFTVVLMVLTFIFVPLTGICELTPQEMGKQDAHKDVSRTTWFIEGFINGCIFSWIMGGGQLTQAANTPPDVAVDEIKDLLGKPTEFVEKYVKAYQSESVVIQYRWSNYGIRSGTGITAALVFAYLIGRLE